MTQEKFNSHFEEYALFWKGAIIALLILLLLIPQAFIRGLVDERQERKDTTIAEVAHKWSEKQLITGPVLSVPYNDGFAHFLPEELHIEGDMLPQTRYRGIYELIVYESVLNISGYFNKPEAKEVNLRERFFSPEGAFITLGISDLRGIQDQVSLNMADRSYAFNSGLVSDDVVYAGIHAKLNDSLLFDSTINQYHFSINLRLKGSMSLFFTPLGKTSTTTLHSEWEHPSFNGAFLPDSEEVSKDGFMAYWKILHLNRNLPQAFKGDIDIDEAIYGVDMFIPVDNYQKSTRSVKYSFLIIFLTFLSFFLTEVLNKKVKVHPFQYFLVGSALLIFYLLLISLSEQMAFNLAYLVSSVGVLLLIAFYLMAVFRSMKLSLMMAFILVLLYAYIFSIIQLQDLALLFGSIGLFLIIAVVMLLTRKIDWYSIQMKKEG